MKKDVTEIIFILDRSGSMNGLEKDTIGGFNAFIDSQKKQKGQAYLTTVLFDDQIELLHDHINIKKVKPLTEKDYYARGMTALLDAIGFGIKRIIQKQKKHRTQADHVIVVISTDGYENSSRHYTYHQIQRLINKEKERYGWEFIFLGARIDAIKEASRIGIHQDRAVRYYEDEEGVEVSFLAVNRFTEQVRQDASPTAEWKKEVEKNYAKER